MHVRHPFVAALLVVLMIAALAIRMVAIDDPILTFHPTRQYRSAIIARACFHAGRQDVPASIRNVSAANRSMQPAGEPPLLEWAACAAYRLGGGENLSIPRAISAAVWVLGAIPLALIAARAVSPAAVLLAVAIHLFTPYAIAASRAFQPDPLMTTCVLIAIWLLIREHEQRRAATLLAAATSIGFALVVKPMSVFLVVPVALALNAVNRASARTGEARRFLALLALGLLPAVLVYGYGAAFGTLARDQMQLRFVPSLLDSRFFWQGWWAQVQKVLGTPLLLAGLAGAVLVGNRLMQLLLASLWLGYALFAAAFTYHMPTHDYYHLPYVAVAALGAAVTAQAFVNRLSRRVSRRPLDVAVAELALAVAAAGAVKGWPIASAGGAERLRDYATIGELSAHDARVLFLDREYGYPLMYHAGISGDAWPSADDLAAEAMGGAATISAADRFARDFEAYGPHYFIATDLESLDAQGDLQELLRQRTTTVADTPSYRIYRFVAP